VPAICLLKLSPPTPYKSSLSSAYQVAVTEPVPSARSTSALTPNLPSRPRDLTDLDDTAAIPPLKIAPANNTAVRDSVPLPKAAPPVKDLSLVNIPPPPVRRRQKTISIREGICSSKKPHEPTMPPRPTNWSCCTATKEFAVLQVGECRAIQYGFWFFTIWNTVAPSRVSSRESALPYHAAARTLASSSI